MRSCIFFFLKYLTCPCQACEISDKNLNLDFCLSSIQSIGAYQISDFISVVLAIFRFFFLSGHFQHGMHVLFPCSHPSLLFLLILITN